MVYRPYINCNASETTNLRSGCVIGSAPVTGYDFASGRDHREGFEDNIYHSDFRGHSLDATNFIPNGSHLDCYRKHVVIAGYTYRA